jgi:putative membrane protein
MRTAIAGAALALFAFAATAWAMGQKDKKFIFDASETGLAEVKVGQLALERGTSDLKPFAQHMIRDHQLANQELQGIAAAKGVTIAVEPNAEQRSEYARLEKLSGKEFDKAFAQLMVNDHEKIVDQFEKQVKNGEDADVKQWAEKMIPVFKHHLKMAQDLVKKS